MTYTNQFTSMNQSEGEEAIQEMIFDRANPNMQHRPAEEHSTRELRFIVERRMEFDSTRKRMSILVRDPRDNRCKLYVKGADSEIIKRLKPIDQHQGVLDAAEDFA